MTSPKGNAAAHAAFYAAAAQKTLHHAWLMTGQQGIGKAMFARQAAARLLAHAADPSIPISGGDLPEGDRTAALLGAGAHPDFRALVRLPKDPDKPDQDIARSIRIDQVRSLQPMFATKPALSARRIVLIDAIDDLERPAANALLKNLEEPPAGTIFLLISHAPGRLLPTIRSRCRTLRFDPLGDDDMHAAIVEMLPDATPAERDALVRASAGSPGRAIAAAGLGLAAFDRDLGLLAEQGDPTLAIRSRMAKALAGKAAQPRYAAFLERAPGFIATAARNRAGNGLAIALDAYRDARTLASFAPSVSLDPAATVFEMAGIVARLAEPLPSAREG